MKLNSLAIIIIAVISGILAVGQQSGRQVAINPLTISIGLNKTSNIIFPYPIIGVDRGTADVLAQKAEGAENILQLKAGRENFLETNITVITKESGFYSFLVNFSENLSPLNIRILSDSLNNSSENNKTETEYLRKSKLLTSQNPFIKKGVIKQDMTLRLNGIYLLEGKMWFVFRTKNASNIDFPIDQISFTIKDKIKPKRTATPEKSLTPLHAPSKEIIKGKEVADIVYVFEPFTISASKQLIVQITEKNGERTIKLPVYHIIILRARKISQLCAY